MKPTFIQRCCCDWLKQQVWFFYDVWSSNKNILYISEISFYFHDLSPNHFPNSICSHISYVIVVLANSELLLTFSRLYHVICHFMHLLTLLPHWGMNSLFLFSPPLHLPLQFPLLISFSWNLTELTWLKSHLNHCPFGSDLFGINLLSSIFL